jgi:hypothetical protein
LTLYLLARLTMFMGVFWMLLGMVVFSATEGTVLYYVVFVVHGRNEMKKTTSEFHQDDKCGIYPCVLSVIIIGTVD